MGAMLSRIVTVGGRLQVSATFPGREDVETEFPARVLETNLETFERTMGISPEHRGDPSVRDDMVAMLSSAVSTAPEAKELKENFWLSYSVGVLWIYLYDPARAEEHAACVLDELVSEGVAKVVVRNTETEVSFAVVCNTQGAPENLRYLN